MCGIQLGDLVHEALSSVGITQDRVEAWLGNPCGCDERRERLNVLGRWASMSLLVSSAKAKEYLKRLVEGQ